MTRFPLLVQIEYHLESRYAQCLAEDIHSVLNDDPAVPGLRIPTCFTPDDGTHVPPEPRISSESDRVLVVVLADDHMTARARQSTPGGRTWAEYVVRLRELCESSVSHRFMPVQLSKHAWPIDPRLSDLNFLRAWCVTDPMARKEFIARRLIHLLIRQLLPHKGDEEASPLTIFLSHTKLDMESEPQVVKELLNHLMANQPEKTWFDSGEISAGSRFAKEIENGITDAALLAVITDSYSSRSWCRREILLAKQYQRPVVVVDAINNREVRSFPYIGNVPVVRWKCNSQEVIDILLREALRHAYAMEDLKQYKEADDDILPSGPELLTLARRGKEHRILYPDPPLGSEELAILEATGIQVETPLERHARSCRFRTGSPLVALSISPPEDIAKVGLRHPHLDAVLLELSRYLLISGIRLAYGGHLRADGYTVRLADLLYDPIIEKLRGITPGGQSHPPQLVVHIAWPMTASVHDEAKLGSLVEVRQCERPSDVNEQIDPMLLPSPTNEVPVDTPERRFAWARGLTEMRRHQVVETDARVLIGGRIGSPTDPYKGRMPGVLEEALFSIKEKKPLYLVGSFGGCASIIIDALEGRQRTELRWEHQQSIPGTDELKQSYAKYSQPWDGYDEIFSLFKETGLENLNNGLDIDENRELARSRFPKRIVELVLTGLHRVITPA